MCADFFIHFGSFLTKNRPTLFFNHFYLSFNPNTTDYFLPIFQPFWLIFDQKSNGSNLKKHRLTQFCLFLTHFSFFGPKMISFAHFTTISARFSTQNRLTQYCLFFNTFYPRGGTGYIIFGKRES